MRTVNDYVGALCTVLRFAYRSGFIRDKPYEDVKKLKRSNTKPIRCYVTSMISW